MSKCAGCGILLQNDDALKEGYTKNLDNKFCERCFRIKNYKELLEKIVEVSVFSYLDLITF